MSKRSPAGKQCTVAYNAVSKAERELAKLEGECHTTCRSLTRRVGDIRKVVNAVEMMMIELGGDIYVATKNPIPRTMSAEEK